MRRIKHTAVAVVLAFALFTGISADAGNGVLGDSGTALAARATAQVDEFENSTAAYIEKTMNKQLIAWLSGSDGTKAKVTKINDSTQYKSQVTFTLNKSRVSSLNIQQLLYYVAEAIYNNPNLCTLSTDIVTNSYYSSNKLELSVKSLVAKSSHASAIRSYKELLADLEYEIWRSTTMSDTDMLLMLHDKLVWQAHYASDISDKWVYIPFSMSKTGVVVCQSYAAVLNHLMRDMGFVSYALTSDTHAWNAVKLDGKWYAIDSTWDDPTGELRSNVDHTYFLVHKSAFSSVHDLESLAKKRFSGIGSSYGKTYMSFFPRKITGEMCYVDGAWFYAEGGRVYRWDGISMTSTIESKISYDANRCVAEVGGDLFVGGTDGVRVYDPESGSFTNTVLDAVVEGLFYHSNKLYMLDSRQWTAFITGKNPYSYEDINGTSNLEKVTLTKPSKPGIKTLKTSAKSIRVTVTKKSAEANSGYQIQYAKNASFTGKSSTTITGMTKQLTSLTKGSKYYVRVRGIWKKGTLKKYGAWSTVAKVQL